MVHWPTMNKFASWVHRIFVFTVFVKSLSIAFSLLSSMGWSVGGGTFVHLFSVVLLALCSTPMLA